MAPTQITRDELGLVAVDQGQPTAMPMLHVAVSVAGDYTAYAPAWHTSLRRVHAGDGQRLRLACLSAGQAQLAEAIADTAVGETRLVSADLAPPELRMAVVESVRAWLQAPIREDLLALDQLLATVESVGSQSVIYELTEHLPMALAYIDEVAPVCSEALAQELLVALETLSAAALPVFRAGIDSRRASLLIRLQTFAALDHVIERDLSAPRIMRVRGMRTSESRSDAVDRLAVPVRLLQVGLDGSDIYSVLDGADLRVAVIALKPGRHVPSESLCARLLSSATGEELSWCELYYDASDGAYQGRLSAEGLGSEVLSRQYVIDVFDSGRNPLARVSQPAWVSRNALALAQDAYTGSRLAAAEMLVSGTPVEARSRLASIRDALSSGLQSKRLESSLHGELLQLQTQIEHLVGLLHDAEQLRSTLRTGPLRPTLAELDLVERANA